MTERKEESDMAVKHRDRGRPASGAAIKRGLPPGSMVFIGETKESRTRIDVFDYHPDGLEVHEDVTVEACAEMANGAGVTWINVTGVHDVDAIGAVGRAFSLHPLTLEDIVNTTQRLKIEEFDTYLYIVMKMLHFDAATQTVEVEHVSLVLGERFVISFQEQEGDVFDGVRGRIRSAKGRIRRMHADYLAYALMDAVIDHYFEAVETIGDRAEAVEDRVLDHPRPADVQSIHRLRRELLDLRRAVWPLRDEIATVMRSDSALIRAETRIYWRDLYDHTVQIIDMVETSRHIIGGAQETYLAIMGHRMNEVMKVLTIIATIFIPLTFVVGIYGMNFLYMPELEWRFGYPLILSIMLGIALGMLAWFRHRGWL